MRKAPCRRQRAFELFGFARQISAQRIERYAEGIGEFDGVGNSRMVCLFDVLNRSDRHTGSAGELRDSQPGALADFSEFHFLTPFTMDAAR